MGAKYNMDESILYFSWISERLSSCSAAFKKLYDFLGSAKDIYNTKDYSKFNLTEKQTEVEELSKNEARNNLIAGEILNENTISHFTQDKLISISTITLLGIIHD